MTGQEDLAIWQSGSLAGDIHWHCESVGGEAPVKGSGGAEKPPKIPNRSNRNPPQPRLQSIPIPQDDTDLDERHPLLTSLSNYPSALPHGSGPSSQNSNFLQPCYLLLYLATFLFVATVCYGIVAFTQSLACAGPPYLYVTHKDSRNVMKYSRDGCLMHEKVLWGVNNQQADLRSMVFGTYKGDEALFVADASRNSSGVLIFGNCFQSTSLRPFVARAIGADLQTHNAAIQHTYGLAIDENGDLYASFQDSNAVLRFGLQSSPSGSTAFQALPLPPNLAELFLTKPSVPKNNSKHNATLLPPYPFPSPLPIPAPTITSLNNDTKEEKKKKKEKKHHNHTSSTDIEEDELPTNLRRRLHGHKDDEDDSSSSVVRPPGTYFPGTFVQFAIPDNGVRSIAWVRNYTELWIAQEKVDGVVIVNKQGQMLSHIEVVNPIGLHYPGSGGYGANDQTGQPSANNPHSQVVFVSSKASKKKSGGAVYAIDIESRAIVKTFHALGMKHPAGVTSHRDVLYVADQTRKAIIAFNITTTRILQVIVPKQHLSGPVEQLILSPC